MAILSSLIGALLSACSGKTNDGQAIGNVVQPQLKMDSSDIRNATNYAKITGIGRDYD